MNKSTCPCAVCKGTATLLRDSGAQGGSFWDCPYCGSFGIQNSIHTNISDERRMQIASFLYHRNLAGYPPLVIVTDYTSEATQGNEQDWALYGIDDIFNSFPDDAMTLLDLALLNLDLKNQQNFHPFAAITLEWEPDFACFYSYNHEIFLSVLAMLANNGLVSCAGADFSIVRNNGEPTGKFSKPLKIVILTKGWQRISELMKRPAGSKSQAFVAMRFHRSTVEIFE